MIGPLLFFALISLVVLLAKYTRPSEWSLKGKLAGIKKVPLKKGLKIAMWAFVIFFLWYPITSVIKWGWNHRPTEKNVAKWKDDALKEANRPPARRSDYTCTITVSKYGDDLPVLVDDARILTVRDQSAQGSCILSRENVRLGPISNEDFERMWRKEFPQLKGPTSEWTVIETMSRTYGTTSCFVYDKYLRGRWQARFGVNHANRKGDVMMEMSDVTRNLFLGSTKDDAEPNEEAYLFTVQCAGGDTPRGPAKQELPEPDVKKPPQTVREGIVTAHT